MDPFTAILTVGGFALQAFGGAEQSQIASQVASAEQSIGKLQIQENQQRQLAMQVNARRQQTETLRQTQLAASMSLTNATGSGSQYGSGLAGGQGQVYGQGAYNQQGIGQNLQIGKNIFGLDSQIDQYKMQIASLQGQQATYQGISSLGSSLMGSAGSLGQLGQQASGSIGNALSGMFFSSGFGSGDPNG